MIQKIITILLVSSLCSLLGCANKEEFYLISEQAPTPQLEETPTQQLQETPTQQLQEKSINEVENQCKIYIGTNGEFKEYGVTSQYADFDNPEKASLYL